MTQPGNKHPRARRILQEDRFREIFAAKRSAADGNLVIYAAPNSRAYSRLGLTVGRKHGGAVQRNRIKRLIREAFRLERGKLPRGYDYVCVPRLGGAINLALYRQSIRTLGSRASARCGPAT